MLPLLREKVFHVTRRSGYLGICADKEIRGNKDGRLSAGFISSMLSFARYYNYVSLFDLRNRSQEELDQGWSGSHPLVLHRDEEKQVVYLILAPSEFSRLIPSGEATTRPLPEGIVILNHVPLECWHPGSIPIESVESVIVVSREPSPPSELERLFEDAGWPKS
jgi:hypothetical protein